MGPAEWAGTPSLATAVQQCDRVLSDVGARRSLDEELSELVIVWREERCTIDVVAVEDPTGKEQSRSLVAFSEPLGSRNGTGQYGCRLDRVLDPLDGCKRPLDAVEVVGSANHSSSARTA
jgi:hypothetical protein